MRYCEQMLIRRSSVFTQCPFSVPGSQVGVPLQLAAGSPGSPWPRQCLTPPSFSPTLTV